MIANRKEVETLLRQTYYKIINKNSDYINSQGSAVDTLKVMEDYAALFHDLLVEAMINSDKEYVRTNEVEKVMHDIINRGVKGKHGPHRSLFIEFFYMAQKGLLRIEDKYISKKMLVEEIYSEVQKVEAESLTAELSDKEALKLAFYWQLSEGLGIALDVELYRQDRAFEDYPIKVSEVHEVLESMRKLSEMYSETYESGSEGILKLF